MTQQQPVATLTDTEPLEVRRQVTFSGVLGAVAAGFAVAYLARATSTGGVIDWVLCGALTLIAIVQFVSLMDARVPLVVADDDGVRFRLGSEWVGLPWLTIGQVITEQRDLPWREGRLVVVPRNPAHVVDSLSPSARRELRWQKRLHGAPLAVPLSVFTRSSSTQVAHDLKRLAAGRTEVVSLRGRERAQLDAAPEARRDQPRLAPAVEAEVFTDEPAPRTPPRIDPVAAVRAARSVMRSDVVRDDRPRIVPAPAPLPEPAPAPAVVEAAVLNDFAPERAANPVIGPEIAAARRRAGLSVDALSERTRIRPHVLEAIEVDDFAPCGGDFYARGHIATLSRYLGLDADELRRQYDDTYASGEINARRVFEAELATGLSGGMRATSGGPRWTLLLGAAMALTMIWGVARYVTDEPAEVANPTVSDSAGLSANRQPITSPLTATSTVSVKAVGQPVRVTISDRSDNQLFSGRLDAGEKLSVVGVGPFTVKAGKGMHVRLWVDDKARGTVGDTVAQASRTVG